MKLRVIGWACYDDDYPDGKLCWPARNAIIDDIRAHKYSFSGWAHQEGYNCAPVLNDGKIYRYSQRGWGDVMAEANGNMGPMDYCMFAFMTDRSLETRPDDDRDVPYDFEPETDLNEIFDLEVSPATFAQAESEGAVSVDSFDNLRYLGEGDMLALTCGDLRKIYYVQEAWRSVEDDDASGEFRLHITLSPRAPKK